MGRNFVWLTILLAGMTAASASADDSKTGDRGRVLSARAESTAARDPKQAEAIAVRGLDDAARLGDGALQRLMLQALANALERQNRFHDAVDALRRCLQITRPPIDARQRAEVNAGLGYSLFMTGDYRDALGCLLEALRWAEETGDLTRQASLLQLVGRIEYNLDQKRRALETLARATEIADRQPDRSLAISLRNNYSNLLHENGRSQEALRQKRAALAEARRLNDRENIAFCLNDFANIYASLGNRELALTRFGEAHRMLKELNHPRETAISLMNMGEMQLQLKRPAAARSSLEEALAIVRSAGLKNELLAIHEMLARTLRELGDWRGAYDSLQRALELNVALGKEVLDKRLAEMQVRYESEKKQKEIEILKRNQAIQDLRLRRQRLLRDLLLAILLLTAMLLAVTVSRVRLKARANRLLARANGELSAARDRLDELSRTDPLTGLANRRGILDRLAEEAVRARRHLRPFALLMADVDHFKSFNDRYGHTGGDAVLRGIADVIRGSLRQQDLAARWGGEELLVLLPETDEPGGVNVAEKIRQRVAAAPVLHQGQELRVTLTLGVSHCPPGSEPETALQRADSALYEGKRLGRDRVAAASAVPAPAEN